MFPLIFVTKVVLDATFCLGLILVGRSLNRSDAPNKEQVTRQSAIATSDNMMQQVSVTLNVNPQQVKVEGGSSQLFHPSLWAKDALRSFAYQGPAIAAGVTVFFYVGLRYLCVQCNKYLARNDSWAAWIGLESCDCFLNRSREDIAKELMPEIQRRYVNRYDLTDFFEPFTLFLHAIESEISANERYIYWYSWLKKTHTTAMFPVDGSDYDSLEKIQDCLIYLRNSFLWWLAEYKIAHNKEMSIDDL